MWAQSATLVLIWCHCGGTRMVLGSAILLILWFCISVHLLIGFHCVGELCRVRRSQRRGGLVRWSNHTQSREHQLHLDLEARAAARQVMNKILNIQADMFLREENFKLSQKMCPRG